MSEVLQLARPGPGRGEAARTADRPPRNGAAVFAILCESVSHLFQAPRSQQNSKTGLHGTEPPSRRTRFAPSGGYETERPCSAGRRFGGPLWGGEGYVRLAGSGCSEMTRRRNRSKGAPTCTGANAGRRAPVAHHPPGRSAGRASPDPIDSDWSESIWVAAWVTITIWVTALVTGARVRGTDARTHTRTLARAHACTCARTNARTPRPRAHHCGPVVHRTVGLGRGGPICPRGADGH